MFSVATTQTNAVPISQAPINDNRRELARWERSIDWGMASTGRDAFSGALNASPYFVLRLRAAEFMQ